MRVRLLGGLAVEGLAERDLGSRKGRTVLKVLALGRGAPVPADRIADVVWGDDQPSQPAEQVSVLVSRLRRVLGSDRICRTDAGYLFVIDWLDIDELEALAHAATQAFADGRVGAARAAADAALALARGPLLPGDEGEWIDVERAVVGATLTKVRRVAVDAAVAAGEYNAAAALSEQVLADDPYDEVVLRALMAAHLAAGRPSSALGAYARARHRLADDLGVSPTRATEALYARALAAADCDAPTASVPSRARLVGREAESKMLDTALDRAATGGAELVVVEGEAGIGKTTLVDTWASGLSDRAIVLRGRCDELGRDLPLQPVSDALADYLQAIGPERSAAVLDGDGSTLAPLLGPLVHSPATVVTDAESAQARVFTALVAVLTRASASAGQPLVLVVEDVHLGGASTHAWLAFARRRCRRTALVVTTRPGGAKQLDATDHLVLGPLALDAVIELVGAERAERLHERSGGHPLLLAALDRADTEQRGDGQELPATVREAVTAQADSLGDDVAGIVRIAAVLGSDCDLALVAQIANRPVVDVLAHLEAAVGAGLVVERGSRFGFRHELVREALESAAGAARRALIHQQAARILAARDDADPLAVAIHARSGGDVALASSSFVAAAVAAAARYDLDAAEEHLVAALDLRHDAAAYVERARVRMSRRAFDLAAADAGQAIALGGGSAALEIAGWVAYHQRRYDEARAYADEAAARSVDDAVRISARALAGRVRHGAGELEGAVTQLAGVDEGPPAVRGIADVWLAQVRVHQGQPVEALEVLARPMVDPDSLAHPWAPLHLRFTRAMALGQLGRVTDALRVVADLDVAVDKSGAVGARFVGPAANVGSWLLRWSGRDAEADERNERALEATGDDRGPVGDAMAEAYYVALLDLAESCLLRSDVGAATQLVERLSALDTWTGTMAWHQRHRLGLLRARLALAAGDHMAAVALATSVAEDAGKRGARRYALLAKATVGLVDRTIPPELLAPIVAQLKGCASLDGWPLVAALAAARGLDAWRVEAERWAAAVVRSVTPEHRDEASRFVDRVLMASLKP